MADAKKCDRCGKYYTENKAVKSNNGSNGSRHVGGIISIDNKSYMDARFDLCDECVVEFFEKFINQEEINMDEDYREVYFDQYCKTCQYDIRLEEDWPCTECLEHPVNEHTHKPVKWELKTEAK